MALTVCVCRRWLAGKLAAMRHPGTRQPVCMLYGAHACMPVSSSSSSRSEPGQPLACFPGAVGQGPVVAFNLLRPDGSFVGYRCGVPAAFDKILFCPRAF